MCVSSTRELTAQLATAQLRAEGVSCPECGSAIDVQADIESEQIVIPAYSRAGEPLPRRRRRASYVAVCSGCEWAIELKGV